MIRRPSGLRKYSAIGTIISDKEFVKYVSNKQEKYEEGKMYTPDQLVQLADNKFRLLKEKGI